MKIASLKVIQFHALACCLMLTTSAIAQSKENYCEPSASLKEELKKIPLFSVDESSYRQRPERPTEALEALAKKYPNDFHVRKRWADARWNDEKADREALVREYKALIEQHPDDPAATYLYAHLMVGSDTKQAIEKLNKLATQSPDFPWIYLELGDIYFYPGFRDQAKSVENLKRWAAKCSSSLENVLFLHRSEDQDLMRDALRRLRIRLDSSPEPEELKHYGDVWSLEFRLTPVTEHARVRQQVVEEVKQLREKNLDNKEWLMALRSGYDLTGDDEGQRRSISIDLQH